MAGSCVRTPPKKQKTWENCQNEVFFRTILFDLRHKVKRERNNSSQTVTIRPTRFGKGPLKKRKKKKRDAIVQREQQPSLQYNTAVVYTKHRSLRRRVCENQKLAVLHSSNFIKTHSIFRCSRLLKRTSPKGQRTNSKSHPHIHKEQNKHHQKLRRSLFAEEV